MCVYIYTLIYIYREREERIYAFRYNCAYMKRCGSINMPACAWVNMFINKYASVCVCVCMYIYIYIYMQARIYIPICT